MLQYTYVCIYLYIHSLMLLETKLIYFESWYNITLDSFYVVFKCCYAVINNII